MFQTLNRLYKLGLMSKEYIAQSTRFDWITPEQYKEITGEDYPEPQA